MNSTLNAAFPEDLGWCYGCGQHFEDGDSIVEMQTVVDYGSGETGPRPKDELDFPTEYGTVHLAFSPADHATAESAAKAFHEALCNLAREMGYDPDIEVWIKTPDEALAHGYGVKAWWVCWESGPYEWGITLSLTGLSNQEARWWTEPYWGFDVFFHQD